MLSHLTHFKKWYCLKTVTNSSAFLFQLFWYIVQTKLNKHPVMTFLLWNHYVLCSSHVTIHL